MGYSSSVYKAAADRLAERRLSAEKSADMRRREIYEKLPRARELEQAIAFCGVEAARTVLRGGNAAEEMTKLKDKNLGMQRELKALLLQNGYAENALDPQYACTKCNDTGYVEQGNRTLMCACLKRELVACACEELNRSIPLSLCTFESFSPEHYSKLPDPDTGLVPYRHMEKVLKYCKGYAQNFTPDSESILMRGNTGLGKTHLSLAIATEVIRRGYGVIYISAPTLALQLEKERFSRDSRDSLNGTLDTLSSCDLLIVDDLGTEFRNSFTLSQIYSLFNARLLRRKPFIISTNLTIQELEREYTDRFVSRINGAAQKLDFIGEDLRAKLK